MTLESSESISEPQIFEASKPEFVDESFKNLSFLQRDLVKIVKNIIYPKHSDPKTDKELFELLRLEMIDAIRSKNVPDLERLVSIMEKKILSNEENIDEKSNNITILEQYLNRLSTWIDELKNSHLEKMQ